MIPKRIFFYWGGSKMSWMRYMTLYSFRKFNPDWEMILFYTENNDVNEKTWNSDNTQDFYSYNGGDYFNKLDELNIKIERWDLKDNQTYSTDIKMCPSHKSNFLKWSKLHEIGGIYSDLDILYFRSIDSFYNILIEDKYDTAICQTEYLSIGLLASKQNNNFYSDIFINGLKNFNNKEYQTAGVLNIYNLYNCIGNIKNTLDLAKQKYKDLKFYNIPMNLVYHLDSTKVVYAIDNSFGINDFPKESIGYHWYAGHPEIQKYNNLLNENTYENYDITFTNLIKEIL